MASMNHKGTGKNEPAFQKRKAGSFKTSFMGTRYKLGSHSRLCSACRQQSGIRRTQKASAQHTWTIDPN